MKINKSWSFINDNEEAIYDVFRGLKDKVQVSQVAAAYQKNHKKDLWKKLESDLSNKELEIVTDIVTVLPDYRTA